MAVPALLYLAAAGGDPLLARGWAIPAATDIAFAIAALALAGSRVPASLKLFLTTIAIADDLGAVAIIATVYTDALNFPALAAAAAILLGLWAMGRAGVTRLWPWLIGAALLWYAVLLSGVHATVAGVLAAAIIPLRPEEEGSVLHRLEHALSPWVAFLVVPLFGFANAGVSLTGAGAGLFLSPLTLGIAAGLFIGKQIGIFAAIWLAIMLKLGTRPQHATWMQLYGIAVLCGIGFTMSLFIGGLAFPDPIYMDEVKVGVLGGSLMSAAMGAAILLIANSRNPARVSGPGIP